MTFIIVSFQRSMKTLIGQWMNLISISLLVSMMILQQWTENYWLVNSLAIIGKGNLSVRLKINK